MEIRHRDKDIFDIESWSERNDDGRSFLLELFHETGTYMLTELDPSGRGCYQCICYGNGDIDEYVHEASSGSSSCFRYFVHRRPQGELHVLRQFDDGVCVYQIDSEGREFGNMVPVGFSDRELV